MEFSTYTLNIEALQTSGVTPEMFNFAVENHVGNLFVEFQDSSDTEIGLWDAIIILNEDGYTINGADNACGGLFNVNYEFKFGAKMPIVTFKARKQWKGDVHVITEEEKATFLKLDQLEVRFEVDSKDNNVMLDYFVSKGLMTKS